MDHTQMADSNAELQALRRENSSLRNTVQELRRRLQLVGRSGTETRNAPPFVGTEEKCDVKESVVRIKLRSPSVEVVDKKKDIKRNKTPTPSAFAVDVDDKKALQKRSDSAVPWALGPVLGENDKKDFKLKTEGDSIVKLECGHPIITVMTESTSNLVDSLSYNDSHEPEPQTINTLLSGDSAHSDALQAEPDVVLNDHMSTCNNVEPNKQTNNPLQGSPTRPKKRQRIVEVVLPPPGRLQLPRNVSKEPPPKSAVPIKHDPDDEMISSLAILQNPAHEVKVDKALLFDDESVYSRLRAIGLEIHPITVEQEIRDTIVPRAFLSSQYGGNMQEVFADPVASKREQHGFDNFFYMSLDYHPNGPQRPGAPGLWFSPGGGYTVPDKQFRVIVRVKQTPRALWLYVGQYKVSRSQPLTPQEWVMQSDATKRAWVDKMIRKPWGWSACARVILRRQQGREPTEDEVDALVKQAFDKPSREELKAAFDTGEEKLYAWAMKCVGYDETFQRDIASKYPTWAPGPKKGDKKKRAARSRGSMKGKETQAAGKKRKRPVEPESEEEPLKVPSEEDDDEDDSVQTSSYQSQGTRSRPISVSM